MGCTHAINLDGGGSSQFYGGGTRYSSGRNVAGYICIWLKKEKVVFDLYKVLPASLNIRKTPNVLGKKLGVYHCGDVIASLGASGEWTKTDRGWVATKYLVKTTQPDGVPYRVTAKALNVRAAAATLIGKRTKVVIGSYVGTGTYGSSNPNTLAIPNAKFVLIVPRIPTSQESQNLGYNFGGIMFLFPTSAVGQVMMANSYDRVVVSSTTSTVSWYTPTMYNSQQNNYASVTYDYIAFVE